MLLQFIVPVLSNDKLNMLLCSGFCLGVGLISVLQAN